MLPVRSPAVRDEITSGSTWSVALSEESRSDQPILKVSVGVEATDQGVPGDGGHDGVDPAVGGRGDQLDPTPVGAAHHAHPGIARSVELDAGPSGHPTDQGAHVAGLVVRAVDLSHPAGPAEASGVPGQHVVARRQQILDGHRAEDAGSLGVGVPGQTPPRAHQHRRGRGGAGGGSRREPVDADLGAVEARSRPSRSGCRVPGRTPGPPWSPNDRSMRPSPGRWRGRGGTSAPTGSRSRPVPGPGRRPARPPGRSVPAGHVSPPTPPATPAQCRTCGCRKQPTPLTTCPGRPRLPPPGAVLPVGPVGPEREPAPSPPGPYLGPEHRSQLRTSRRWKNTAAAERRTTA